MNLRAFPPRTAAVLAGTAAALAGLAVYNTLRTRQVEREHPPLIFFRGGYGRFTP